MDSNYLNSPKGNKTINLLLYSFLKEILRIRGFLFELIHRKGLKKFLHNIIPKNVQNTLLRKHINNLLDFPVTFSIEITNICNAKCWFCPTHTSERTKGSMDFSLFRKIIDEIKPLSKKIRSIALFMDGEPTLHKEIVDFLKYSAYAGIKRIYISSNMEYLTPELTNKIFEGNLGDTLQYVICSIDGTSNDTYNKNRIGCDFKKSLSNTEYLIKQKNLKRKLYPWVFTRLLVSDLTKNEVNSFKAFWKGRADKVLCYDMHNWGGGISNDNLNTSFNGKFTACYFPFSQFAIQYDGTVRLCCIDANSSTIIGDLNHQSIREIWNDRIINEIRENQLTKKINTLPKICRNCSYPRKGSWTTPFFWQK